MIRKLLSVDPNQRPDIKAVLKQKFLKPYIEEVLVSFEKTRHLKLREHLQSRRTMATNTDQGKKEGDTHTGQGVSGGQDRSLGELIESKIAELESKYGQQKLMLLYTAIKVDQRLTKHREIGTDEVDKETRQEIEELLSLEAFYF